MKVNGTDQRRGPAWLKVLLISFTVTFTLGYLADIQNLNKDIGKEGVPNWHENYWQCVQSCSVDALVIAVIGTSLAMLAFGIYRLVAKNR